MEGINCDTLYFTSICTWSGIKFYEAPKMEGDKNLEEYFKILYARENNYDRY